MKLSDIPIPGAPDLGSLEDIATALRNFLNEARPSKQDSLFLDFVNQLYKSSTLEDLYPLHFVMKRSINEENLQAACAIIKKNGWALKESTWNDRTIFSTSFMKLAAIPIFLPTIYPGILSAVFLLFLLFPNEKTGMHFYRGLRKKQRAKDIILEGFAPDINTLQEMYLGMRAAHKKSSYLAKIEQTLHLSFKNILLPSFSKKNIRKLEDNDLFSILEAYDYASHIDCHHLHKRYFSKPPLFNDEVHETVFKTILLILSYQKNALTSSIYYYAKLHGFIGNNFQFHLAHEACILLSKTALMFSCVTDENAPLQQYLQIFGLGKIESNLDSLLQNDQNLLHPKGDVYQDPSPLTTEQRFLFFTIVWAIERNSAIRRQRNDWKIWHILDGIDRSTAKKDKKQRDAIRRVFSKSIKNNTYWPGIATPIRADGWDNFYKQYHDETDIICAGIKTEHEKEKIWNRAIVALLFIVRADLNAPHDQIGYWGDLRFSAPASDVREAKKLKAWRSENSEMTGLLPLSQVWSMMILYIVSDQIYVHQNGHDTKFFSEINSNQAAASSLRNSKKYTLKYYIDNIYRHSYEEIEDLKQVLSRLAEIVPQRWCFSDSFKEKWKAFIQETSEAFFTYMNANAYHYIETQPYPSMHHHFEKSKKLLIRIYGFENNWMRAMGYEKDAPWNIPNNIREYLIYTPRILRLS